MDKKKGRVVVTVILTALLTTILLPIVVQNLDDTEMATIFTTLFGISILLVSLIMLPVNIKGFRIISRSAFLISNLFFLIMLVSEIFIRQYGFYYYDTAIVFISIFNILYLVFWLLTKRYIKKKGHI